MFNIHKIPFFRLLIPYILGIVSSLSLNLSNLNMFCLISVVIISYGLFYIGFKLVDRKKVVTFLADLLLFCLGFIYTYNSQTKNDTAYFKNYIKSDTIFYLAELTDLPVQKERSVKLNLNVLKVKNDTGYTTVKGAVIAYLQKNNVIKQPRIGQVYLIKSALHEVREPMNPHEFNFKNYLANKNIYHTTFIDSNSFKELYVNNAFSLQRFGLGIKQSIVEQLKESGLDRDAYTICSALITGFDDEIDKKVIEEFSHSGTLHVLSVSGLHVGLIYLVLNFMFLLIDRNKKHPILHFIFITLCLWFFATITGFSAPVLRAVIMFNLLGIGKLFFRNKPDNQLNILFVSAFVLLLVDPLLIRDLGFLLSYSAMFGILYFYPKWVDVIEPKNKIVAYIWQSSVLSFSATLTTLPITLLVFHQFPIWFALANLIIVPLSFILLILSFVSLFKITFISILINKLTAWLLVFIKLFNAEGIAFIDHIDFTKIDALMLTIFICMLSLTLLKRRFVYAQITLAILIFWQLHGLFTSYQTKSKNELVIYHYPKGSTKSLKMGNRAFIDFKDSAKYSMHVKPNITSYNYPFKYFQTFNYTYLQDIQLLALSDKNKVPVNKHLKFTHLLISNNAVPQDQFFGQYRFKLLIADGSNSRYSCRVLKDKCEKHGISFYSTAEQGAFILPLALK